MTPWRWETIAQGRAQIELGHGGGHINFQRQPKRVGGPLRRRQGERLRRRDLNGQRMRRVDLLLNLLMMKLFLLDLLLALLLLPFLTAKSPALGNVELRHFFPMRPQLHGMSKANRARVLRRFVASLDTTLVAMRVAVTQPARPCVLHATVDFTPPAAAVANALLTGVRLL